MDLADARGIVFEADNNKQLVYMQSNGRGSSILQAMYETDSFCDVSLYGVPPPATLLASLKPIRAYKNVLVHASPHLHDLFTADGFIDSHQSEYNIENVNHESLRSIVKFIHADQLVLNEATRIAEVRGILIGAKYLVMTKLADACEAFLSAPEQLKLNNCVQLWCFARKYSCLEVMHACSTFIVKHICDMPTDADFLCMPYADCAKLLMCEAFCASDANHRYRAAIAWLLHDTAGRADSVCDILNMIPFVTGPLSFTAVAEAGACDMLRKNAPDMLHQAMLSAIELARQKCEAAPPAGVAVAVAAVAAAARAVPLAVVPAPTATSSVAIGPHVHGNDNWFILGGNTHFEHQSFLQYDILRRSWSYLPPLPWNRTDAGMCAVGKKLIVFGGGRTDPNVVIADIAEFDVMTKKWSCSNALLDSPRDYLSACSDGRYAYALGGRDGATSVSVVERYDVGSQEIVDLGDMLTERQEFAVAFSAKHNSMFVSGGLLDDQSINSIEQFDFATETWLEIGKLARARCKLGATVSGDDLYMCGGSDHMAFNSIEIFNIHTSQRRYGPKLLKARKQGHATTLYNGNVICLLGGCTDEFFLSSIDSFDVREGKWSSGIVVPDMPKTFSNSGFAAV